MGKQRDHVGALRTMIHQREDGEPCICAECRAITAAISALTVDKAMVERAGIAMAVMGREGRDPTAHWNWLHEDERARFRAKARAALQAAIHGESHE